MIQRPNQLVIIRHAESARNHAKKGNIYFPDDESRAEVRGIPDHKIPITNTGVAQARITGGALRMNFGVPDYLYHSGYLRTEQTAMEILSAYSESQRERIKVRMDASIREREPGYTYDMTTAEAESAFPWLHEYWQTFGGFFARPPGGESLSDVRERVYGFLNMLFRDRAGKTVFVVTHGGTIRLFRFLLERWNYDRAERWSTGQEPRNCGVTVYNFDPEAGRLVLSDYNVTYFDEELPY